MFPRSSGGAEAGGSWGSPVTMTQAEKGDAENGKEKGGEKEKEQRGVKRPIVPALVPESLQEVRLQGRVSVRAPHSSLGARLLGTGGWRQTEGFGPSPSWVCRGGSFPHRSLHVGRPSEGAPRIAGPAGSLGGHNVPTARPHRPLWELQLPWPRDGDKAVTHLPSCCDVLVLFPDRVKPPVWVTGNLHILGKGSEV